MVSFTQKLAVRKIITIFLIFAIFLVCTTAVGLFLPLTFNIKLPTGGFLLILGFLIGSWNRVFYEPTHKLLALYVLIQTVFVLVTYLFYGYNDYQFLTDNVLKVFVTAVVAMSAVWFVYKGIILAQISLLNCLICFSIGTLATAIIMFWYMRNIGIADVYAFRDELFRSVYSTASGFSGADISNMSFRNKLFVGWFLTLGGTPVIGPLLSMCGTTLITLGIFLKPSKTQIICFLIGVVTVASILLTGSRSALVSLIACVVFIPLFVFSKHEKITAQIEGRIFRRVYGIIVLFLLSALLFWDTTAELIQSGFSRMTFEKMAETARLPLWIGAIELAIRNPLGYGYEYVRLTRALKFGAFPGGVFLERNHLHNTYLTNLNEFGVIGLVVFLLLFKAVLSAAINNVKSYGANEDFSIAVALLSGIICAMINMLFGSMFLGAEAVFGGTFWLLVAMVLVMSHRRKQQTWAK